MRPGRPDEDGPEMARHSGWMLLLAVGAAMAVLCAVVLLYYLALPPVAPVEERVSPSVASFLVRLRVAGLSLEIPANYLPYESERSGGPRSQIVLYAELPHFRGYSVRNAAEFGEDEAKSSILHILLKKQAFDIAESVRLDRIYLDAVVDRRGREARFGLHEYTFRDDSGYRGEDLFVGLTNSGVAVMRCSRGGGSLPPANCLREFQLGPDVSLSYRFARSRLPEWHQIADGVNRLVATFRGSRSR